jgi:hypothetical protein
MHNMHMDYSQNAHALRKNLQVGWKLHILGFQRPTYDLLKQETFKFDIFIVCGTLENLKVTKNNEEVHWKFQIRFQITLLLSFKSKKHGLM